MNYVSGTDSIYKMGEKHIQHPGARSSPLCLSCFVPKHSSSFLSFHVDGWSHLWLWKRVSVDSLSCIYRCYSSFLNRTSLPPQDASKHHHPSITCIFIELVHLWIINFGGVVLVGMVEAVPEKSSHTSSRR